MWLWDHKQDEFNEFVVSELKHLRREINLIFRAFLTEDFELHQLQGDDFMAINGTIVGTTSTFQISFVPATNFVALQSGPTVAVDDANVTLSPVSTDGQFTFTASVAASDTATSYNLTVSGVNGAGVAVSHTFNVPILPTPPPPPQQITDFGLNQLS